MHLLYTKRPYRILLFILTTAFVFHPTSSEIVQNKVRLSLDDETSFTERYLQLQNFQSIESVLIRASVNVENSSRFGEAIDLVCHSNVCYAIIGAPHQKKKTGAVYLCAYEKLNSTFRCETDGLPVKFPPKGNEAGANGMLLGSSVSAFSSNKKTTTSFGLYCGHLYRMAAKDAIHFRGLCNLLSLATRKKEPVPLPGCQTGSCLFGFSTSLGISRHKSEQLLAAVGTPSTEIKLGKVMISTILMKEGQTQPNITTVDPSNFLINDKSFYKGFDTDLAYKGREDRVFFSTMQSFDTNVFEGKVDYFQMSENQKFIQKKKSLTSPTGQGYGFSLTSIDFSDSRIDRKDLLVGEPFCNDPVSGTDAGCVHIYCNNFNNHTILVGPESNGRFGTSVARIDDINGDSIDDFVIGCPYCDQGRGVVFFFFGNKQCSFKTADQIIRARDFLSHYPNSPSLAGFGMSLSHSQDIDGNGYSDFIVGAPRSNLAVLIRSRTFFSITRLKRPYSCVLLSDFYRIKKCVVPFDFVIKSLARSEYADNIKLLLRFKFTMDSKLARMKRLQYDRHYEYNVTKQVSLSDGSAVTSTVMVTRKFKFVKEHLNYDSSTPMVINCSVEMLDSSDSTINQQYPLPQVVEVNGDWSTPLTMSTLSCGTTGCKTDVAIEVGRDYLNGIILYGSANVSLPIIVRNYGPDRLRTCHIRIRAMNGLFMLQMRSSSGAPVSCRSTADDIEICDITSFMLESSVYEFSAEMDTLGLTRVNKMLESTSSGRPGVSLEVVGSGIDENNENNKLSSHFKVIYDPQITFLAGSASQQTVIDQRNSTYSVRRRERVHWQRLGPKMTQSYQLANKGLSDVYGIRINISVPMLSEIGDPLIYLSSQVRVGGNSVVAGPRVISGSGRSHGNCSIPSGFDNPLNISIIGDTEVLRRFRRSADQRLSSASLFDSSTPKKRGKSKVSIVCGEQSVQFGFPRCIVIQCTIDRLVKNDVVRILMEGWLWAETMQKKYISDIEIVTSAGGQMFEIPSNAVVRNASNLEIPKLNQTTQFIFTNVSPPTKSQLPIWTIILAVIVGIIILSCIVLCLKKLGFFKRRRQPYAAHNLQFMKYGESLSEMPDNHFSEENKMKLHGEESEAEPDETHLLVGSASTKLLPVTLDDSGSEIERTAKMAPRSIDTGISDEINSSSSSPAQALQPRDKSYESPSLGMGEDASI